jgi:hypothetical protein
MPIDVKCRECGQRFRLRDDMAGRTVRCRCGRPLAVPDPRTNIGLVGLLVEELSRPQQPPTEQEEATTPHVSTLRGSLMLQAPAPEGSAWSRGLARGLRSVVGALGLGYGLVMLGIGSRAVWQFALATYLAGFFKAPWSNAIYLMIGASGLLLAVASVGVLIGRRDGDVKARFASGALVVLWLGSAFLVATSFLHDAADKDAPVLTAEVWKRIGMSVVHHLPWIITPALLFSWCFVKVKRDSREER